MIGTSPGWLYDASSGVCAGPASYEQAAEWKASGGRPIHTTYAGGPVVYIIRQRRDFDALRLGRTEKKVPRDGV